MAAERLFVDTWGWLVLANSADPHFACVKRIRESAQGRAGAWVTTDYVLDETMTRLFALAPFALARRFILKTAVDAPLTRMAALPCSAGGLAAGSFRADSPGVQPTHPLGEARHIRKPRPALDLRPAL
jgi:predicted nucleic acid-binding protein